MFDTKISGFFFIFVQKDYNISQFSDKNKMNLFFQGAICNIIQRYMYKYCDWLRELLRPIHVHVLH